MTEQEIMQLVEETGMFALIGPLSNLLPNEIVILQRFANKVAEHEWEACATDCDSAAASLQACPSSPENRAAISAIKHRAAAIRSRNKGE